MALLTISGEPASRWEEVANGAAQLLRFEMVTETRLTQWISEEFGEVRVPDRAWPLAVVSILSRMATEHHLVVALAGAESLFGPMPMLLRAGVVAPEARRVGNVMLDQRLERPAARKALAAIDAEARRTRKARFGRGSAPPDAFDVMLNAEHMDATQMAEILRAAAIARGLEPQGLFSPATEAQLQF